MSYYWSSEIPKPTGPYSLERNYENDLNKNISRSVTQQGLREPVDANPFMNVPVTAYDTDQLYTGYNIYDENGKDQSVSSNEKRVREETDKIFINKLYQDPADSIFQRNNSQRQFYTVAVGSVPSNQTGYSEWLYGNNQVCKAGSIWMRYPNRYNNDSLVCNGYNVSTPTNFGNLNN